MYVFVCVGRVGHECELQFNPKSFTQTVENVFDISFLAKEGRAGVRFGSEGTLFGPTNTPKIADHVPNKQSIFKLDFNMCERGFCR